MIRWFVALVLAVLVAACPPAPSTSKAPAIESGPSVADILASSQLPATLDRPVAGDKMGVTIHRLRNGISVYISTDRQKPQFRARIAVRAGARHDPASSTGLAHYLEHMLFKGTDEYGTTDIEAERPHLERIEQLYGELRGANANPRAIFEAIDRETQAASKLAIPNELDRMYEGLGIDDLNAYTSREETAYSADVPSNRLEAWATVEAERFSDPVFRLFYPELEAVYEEKNLALDSPEERVWDTMMLALFPRHPYGTQPIIGSVEHLKVPAYRDMVEFFARWYVPNNMAVVLAGDIDAETALPVLERTLGRLEPRPIDPLPKAALDPLSGRVVREVVAEGEQSVTLAWSTVAIGHADEPVFEVLEWLMDNDQSGLLNLELELTQRLPDVTSGGVNFNEAGLWMVEATAREGQKLEDVERMLLDVVAKLRAGDFTEAEVEAIVLHEDISEKERLETNDGRVSKMAAAFISRRGWREILDRDARLGKVTREDVIRVANRYLGSDYAVVFRREGKHRPPKIDKPEITAVAIDAERRSQFAERIAALRAVELEPAFLVEGDHYVRTDSGAGPVLMAHNRRNDLFSVSYEFDRGYRKEPLLCYALDLLELAGTKQLSPDALQKKLFALGTTVDIWCSTEASSVVVRGVQANLRESLELLDQWFRGPTLDRKLMAKLLANTLSRRRDQLEDPEYLAAALDQYAVHGKRSDWLALASNRALQRARAAQLLRLIRSFPDHQHRTLYFGAALESADALRFGDRHRRVGPPRSRRYRSTTGTRIYFLHKDLAKAEINITMPRPPLSRAQRPAAKLLSHYLGGSSSSLVFQEIREARGLAYHSGAWYSVGDRTGDDSSLVGWLGTQGDKTPEALRTFLTVLHARPLSARRLVLAKQELDQAYRSSRIDPRFSVDWVDAWNLIGEPTDPRPWERASIAGLSHAEVQAFATTLDDAVIIISVMGDRDRVDLSALRELGDVVEVRRDQVFSYGAFP